MIPLLICKLKILHHHLQGQIFLNFFSRHYILDTVGEHIKYTQGCYRLGYTPTSFSNSNLNSTIMANSTAPVANAPLTTNVVGFTYIKDYAALTAKINDKLERIIIGSKSEYPMSEMFMLKQAESITVLELAPKTVNGTEYKRFALQSINF